MPATSKGGRDNGLNRGSFLRHGFLASRPEGLRHLLRAGRFRRWLVERADDSGDGMWRYGGIACGGIDTAVAEKHLNGASVGSVFEKVGGETVAQSVGSHALFNAGEA